jgi:hypothetical protein
MVPKINNLTLIAKPHIDQIIEEVTKIVQKDCGRLTRNYPKFKKAFRIAPIFETRIFRIIDGIINLINEDNLYGCKILLRSLIDHTVKLDFLLQKALKDKNDRIFNEYSLFSDLAEELQYLKELNYKSKIINEVEIDEKALNDLIKRKPQIKKYSNKHIFEKANQFSFRNMFKFLNEERDKDDLEFSNEDIKAGFEAYLEISALYSDLSSFIHGGPSADQFELLMHLDKNEHDNEVIQIIEHIMVLNFYACITFIGFCNKLKINLMLI